MNIKKATLLGMLLAFGLSICSTFAVTVQDNVFQLNTGNLDATFKWDGGYCITDKQPWGDSDHPNAVYIDNNPSKIKFNIFCGRKGSSEVSYFVNSKVSGTTSGDILFTNNMNFAISGTLTIEGNKYQIIIGQYGDDNRNTWVIGGENFSYYRPKYCLYTPDHKYAIAYTSQDSITISPAQ